MHAYLKSHVPILYVLHSVMHTNVHMDTQTYTHMHAHNNIISVVLVRLLLVIDI